MLHLKKPYSACNSKLIRVLNWTNSKDNKINSLLKININNNINRLLILVKQQLQN